MNGPLQHPPRGRNEPYEEYVGRTTGVSLYRPGDAPRGTDPAGGTEYPVSQYHYTLAERAGINGRELLMRFGELVRQTQSTTKAGEILEGQLRQQIADLAKQRRAPQGQQSLPGVAPLPVEVSAYLANIFGAPPMAQQKVVIPFIQQ